MIQPAGTFLAKVRDGALQLPPPVRKFCESSDWTLFRVKQREGGHLELQPVLPAEVSGPTDELHSSLSSDGRVWIPAPLRAMVGLGEQSVMVRIEGGSIAVYLRKVFETLGFGP